MIQFRYKAVKDDDLGVGVEFPRQLMMAALLADVKLAQRCDPRALNGGMMNRVSQGLIELILLRVD